MKIKTSAGVVKAPKVLTTEERFKLLWFAIYVEMLGTKNAS